MDKTGRSFRSFEAADEADREYYRGLTPKERVELACRLMERSKMFYDDPPQGLERVCRIIPLAEH